jgi:hypothetical protein
MIRKKQYSNFILQLSWILLAIHNIYSKENFLFSPMYDILKLEGKAEIAQYKGKVKRYNQYRDAHLVLITVFEPFDYNQLAKKDDSLQYVLKQNQVLSYQTGVYPYREMNSLFWNPQNHRLVKGVMTSQEWCGQSFKQIIQKKSIKLHFHTYWDKEVEGEYTYPIPENLYLFYDELPLILRFINQDFYQKEILLFPLLMNSRVNQTSWDIYSKMEKPDFKIAILSRENTKILYKGKTIKMVKFMIDSNGKRDSFYFDWNHPYHILIKWERNDGGYFELDHLSYAKYWELNNVGDKLPENVYRNY